MTWQRIPKTLRIRGEKWSVVWKQKDDSVWRDMGCWGMTDREEKEIHLCDSLKALPGKLQEVWLHELLHACLPLRVKDGRPRGLDRDSEEKLVTCVSDVLANVLNQTGWKC